MAGVIDSLLIVLGFDTSGLTQGQKDVDAVTQRMKDSATRSGKAIEESADRASKSVEALGRKFLGLYALVTGGEELKAFVSNMTSADAALGRTARNVDMNAKSLSTWQGVAEAAGGSAEGITGTISNLSSAMQEAALTGNNRLAPVMRALGVNLADTGGHARNVGDVLTDLNRRYNAMHIDPARFASMMHMIGVDDGTINLLERSTTEFDKLRQEQEKYAATTADADAAQRRQSGWRELLLTSQSLGRSILTALTPAITGAMKAVQQWADANQAWIRTAIVEKIGQFVDYLKGLDWKSIGDGLQGFIGNVRDIATAVAGAVKGIDSNSPLYKGLEALAVLAGTRLALAFTGLTSAIGGLSAVSLPGWFGRMLGMGPAGLVLGGTAAVGAVLASGDPNKALLDGGRPDVQPQDNDLGLPGVGEDRKTDTSDAKAKAAEAGGLWERFKKAIGWGDRLHDDTKTRDGVTDTAKATGEIRDLMKAQKDGLASSTGDITAGGGAPNLRYGHGSGGGYRATPGTEGGAPLGQGAKGGRFKGGGANAAMAKESYDFWRGKGLDHNAALSMVAQEQGESGFNVRSRGDYVNGNPTAHGIFQWHADRRAAILKDTGINVDTADHKQQLEAAFYEGTKGMRAGFLQSLNGRSLADAVHQGVHRFEGSANQPKDTAIRLKMAQGWDGGGSFLEPKPSAQAPVPAGTSAAAVTDAEVFAARQRITNGSRDPKDHALVDRYLKEQNTPKAETAPATHGKHGTYETHGKPLPAWMSPGADGPITTVDHRDPKFAPHALDPAHQKLADAMRAAVAPTVGHAVHAALHAMAHANHLLQHGDRPMQVEDKSAFKLQERTFGAFVGWGKRHPEHLDQARAIAHGRAASLAAMTRMADVGRYSVTQHANNSHTEHHIHGDINVQTRATDAKGIAGDLGPYLFQGSDARQANRGLA